MELKIKNQDLTTLGELTKDPRLEKEYRYGSSNKTTEVEIDSLLPATVQTMIQFSTSEARQAPTLMPILFAS